jgi:hypothetical protein
MRGTHGAGGWNQVLRNACDVRGACYCAVAGDNATLVDSTFLNRCSTAQQRDSVGQLLGRHGTDSRYRSEQVVRNWLV